MLCVSGFMMIARWWWWVDGNGEQEREKECRHVTVSLVLLFPPFIAAENGCLSPKTRFLS